MTSALLSIASHVWIALRSRQEPKDERDEAISARSLRNAYVVLLSLLGIVLFCPSSLWWGQTTGATYTALLLCFIAAETTRFFSQAVYYRRGWIGA